MALQCLPEAFDSACWWGSFETYQHASCQEWWPFTSSPQKTNGWSLENGQSWRMSAMHSLKKWLLNCGWTLSKTASGTSSLCLANTFIPFDVKNLPVWSQWLWHPVVPSFETWLFGWQKLCEIDEQLPGTCSKAWNVGLQPCNSYSVPATLERWSFVHPAAPRFQTL